MKMGNPISRGNSALKRLSDKFQEQGQGDGYVNLGMIINDRIANLAMEVITDATEIQNLLPEMKITEKNEIQNRYKQLNTKLPHLRNNFTLLVNFTKGHFHKTAPNDRILENIIKQAIKHNNTPLGKGFKTGEYVKSISSYFDQLVEKNIIPITTTYREEGGMNRLLKQ